VAVRKQAVAEATELRQALRVLIANERRDRLALLAEVVASLGHQVIAEEIEVADIAEAAARELPDVALIGLGLDSQHALDLIGEVVRDSICPVIAILHEADPAYLRQAAKRGVFAYIVDGNPADLQSTIEITLARFAEYHALQGAFGRRATIEQAKGVLMERYQISADEAFERLRERSRIGGHKLHGLAAALVESHLLLLQAPPAPPPQKHV
jgi:AmiR/NasT family two-component response regulator